MTAQQPTAETLQMVLSTKFIDMLSISSRWATSTAVSAFILDQGPQFFYRYDGDDESFL